MTLEASSSASAHTAEGGVKVHSPNYVPGLDLLRFFAATIVTVYHLAFWAWAYPDGQVAVASRGVAEFHDWARLTSGGWAGVQIFFVISGFVIATSSENSPALRFLMSRLVRLVPGVWVCATITFIAWLLIDVGSPGEHLQAYLRSLAFMPYAPWIDSVYWTLGVEVVFYTLVFLLLVMHRFDWLKPIVLLIGAGSTLFWIGYTVSSFAPESRWFHHFNNWQWSRLGELLLIKHGVFFATGVVLWLRLVKRVRRLEPWLVIFLFGGVLQIAGETALKFEKTGMAFSPLWPAAMWLLAMAWMWVAVLRNAQIQRLPTWALNSLRRLGLMTYPLYLLHNVAGGAVMGALATHGLSHSVALWFAIVIVMGLSWWVSRVPEPMLQRSMRAFFRTVEQWDARAAAGGPLVRPSAKKLE